MKLLDVVHPAAKTLVDIAKSQDAEVGDGTTSVVLLAGEFLKQVKPYIEEGVHSQIIIRSVRKATQLAIQHINEIAVKVIAFNRCTCSVYHNILCLFRPTLVMQRTTVSRLKNAPPQPWAPN